jgi:predicted DsbA family dithiol-disulfide isomerase
MKLEVWSDIVCPWCGIGHHRLQRALARFEHADAVEVHYRSYQLDKHAPEDTTWPVREHLMGKYGLDEAGVEGMLGKIEQVAAADGLTPYRLRDNIRGNTGLAHELCAFATARGLGPAAWARMYRAYFGEARSIFDIDSLVPLGVEIGLDETELRHALTERRYRFTVDNDDHAARSRGVEGVPFHIFAGRYILPGAETVETVLKGLQLGWEHEHPVDAVLVGDGRERMCGPDGCEV